MEQMTEAGSVQSIKEASADVFWAVMRLADEIVHALLFWNNGKNFIGEFEYRFCQFAHMGDCRPFMAITSQALAERD